MLSLESGELTISESMLRADRVSRLGDKWLERVTIDHCLIERLSNAQIGMLAEAFLGLETMLGRLVAGVSGTRNETTMVLYASKEAGADIYTRLVESGHCEDAKNAPEQWRVGNLCFSSIEKASRADLGGGFVDGVILLDPTCMVYRARSLQTYRGRSHDRPQVVVDFLADHTLDGVRPYFLLMTSKRAAALPTDTIARAFCLEAFWFLDGPSMTWG